MKNNQSKYLFLFAILLAVYYMVLGIYLTKSGYLSPEALFYIEKSKIILDGLGNKLKVMGLTSPILPFYASFIFAKTNLYGPLIASCLCTSLLFYTIAATLVKQLNDSFYLLVLLIIFVFHPGILYVACSGKSIAMVLFFFFLFFFNLFRFYQSNTTFHVSIASICLVLLIFSDYKFIWLTLFFIPLVLSITLKTLNLGEQESIFRLFISFNNPSLRRKLINKTFALYIILFILPVACVICYKLLNLTHANDLNYSNESPYSTWAILADKLSYDHLSTGTVYQLPETAILISFKILIFCPFILIALYLFRGSTYQILTLLTPFGFVEFLHAKYEKVFLAQEYYLMFLVLALLGILYKVEMNKRQPALKLLVGLATFIQLYTGYFFLENSSINEEHAFAAALFAPAANELSESRDMADYLNNLPADSRVLVDDAIAYPIVAYTENIHKLTLPYQNEFLSAIESPDKYDDYILLASENNEETGFTQLNVRYVPVIKKANSSLKLRRVHETNGWILYKIFDN